MAELLTLRVLHLLGGMFWVGTMIFLTVFLLPALRASGPAGTVVLAALYRRRLLAAMPLAAVITILTGFILAWRRGGDSLATFAGTPSGRMFLAAGGLAVVAFLIGFLVLRPVNDEMARLIPTMASVTDADQRAAMESRLESLRQRDERAAQAMTVLVVLTAIGMAVARYVG